MEWHKAKNILIVLFLFVNIFLLFVLYNNNSKSEFDKNSFEEILLKNNIEVDLDSLPSPKSRIFVPEFYGIDDDMIHLFIPKILKVENTTYSDEKRTLIVTGNKISFSDSAPFDINFRGVNKKNIVSRLKPFLKKLGVDKYVISGEITEAEGMYYAEFTYRINSKKIFNNKLTFLVSPSGIIKCEGAVYVPNKNSGYSYDVNTPETILMQFGQNQEEGVAKVISMNLGTYVLDYESAITIQAVPVYEIVTEKRTYIYDARTGVDLQNRELKG